LARAKVRCVFCVVSFSKFHYNDLLPASCQQVGNFPVYREVTGKRVYGFRALLLAVRSANKELYGKIICGLWCVCTQRASSVLVAMVTPLTSHQSASGVRPRTRPSPLTTSTASAAWPAYVTAAMVMTSPETVV